MKTLITYLREKFDPVVVGLLFLICFLVWIFGPIPPERSDNVFNIVQGLLYGFLAMLGVRPRAQGPAIQATNIETASTETGDIAVGNDTTSTTDRPPADI